MLPRASLALLWAGLFAASPVSAEDGKDAAKAEKLFAESAEAYRAGRFDRAIELLNEAYRLSGEPVLLFNLAKAQEGQGDLPAAIASYEKYLREGSMIPDRGAIEQRVRTLRAQVESRALLEKKAEQERLRAERAEREKPSPSPVPWILAGVGVAGLAVGGGLASLAKSKEEDANDEPSQVSAAALRDEGETLAIGANVSFAIGAAVLAGGLVWGIVDVVVLSGEPASPSAALRIEPHGARFVVRF